MTGVFPSALVGGIESRRFIARTAVRQLFLKRTLRSALSAAEKLSRTTMCLTPGSAALCGRFQPWAGRMILRN